MKIRKVYEENKEKYYEKLGYDNSLIGYLSSAYQLWCDAEGLEQLSGDEQDTSKLTDEQNKFLETFITIWDISQELENYYRAPDWDSKRIGKKYNI